MAQPLTGLEPVITAAELAQRVQSLGAAITQDYQSVLADDESLLVIGVLNGAFIFMADLLRAMDLPIEIDFVRLSSYQDQMVSASHVVMLKNLETEIKDRHVLVVEDIADLGLTLAWLLEFLRLKEPRSLKLAVAINKLERRRVNLALDYVGFDLEEGFLVGYGLDYAHKHRNLPGIYKLRP
ncbi:MAG: hypoxanthine phosphoribosyltransferase [Deltaproteobacteria bacterium]|jgi:hypoxanthine phosphoribosyltransferase|nr:hypoxanthine phosphoribosyltransferase [Deltaproteobacteria bacterium]